MNDTLRSGNYCFVIGGSMSRSRSSLPRSADPAPNRVLVVDHDPWASRAITAALAGSSSLTLLPPAHTGTDALETLISARPNAVVMALNLPGPVSAIELISEMLRYHSSATIVVLTTTELGPRVSGALRAGAAAVVHKSVAEHTLRQIVLLAASGRTSEISRIDTEAVLVRGDPRLREYRSAVSVSPREREILTRICQGHTDERIAAMTGLSVWTVKSHAYNLRAKFQAKNRSQLILRAIEQRFFVA